MAKVDRIGQWILDWFRVCGHAEDEVSVHRGMGRDKCARHSVMRGGGKAGQFCFGEVGICGDNGDRGVLVRQFGFGPCGLNFGRAAASAKFLADFPRGGPEIAGVRYNRIPKRVDSDERSDGMTGGSEERRGAKTAFERRGSCSGSSALRA